MANPPYYEWENFKLKATTAAEFTNALMAYGITTSATLEDQDLTVVYTGPSWTETTTQKGFKVTTTGGLELPKTWNTKHIKEFVGLKLYEINNQTSTYTLVMGSSKSNTTGSSITFRVDDDGNGRGFIAYTPEAGAFDISVTIENHGSYFQSYSAQYFDNTIYFYGEGGSSGASTVTESITYTVRYTSRTSFFQQNKTYLLAGAELVTTHTGYYTENSVDFLRGSPTVHISTSKISTNFTIYPLLDEWQRPTQYKYSYPFFGVKQKGLAGWRRDDETKDYPSSKLFTSSQAVAPFTDTKAPLQFGYTTNRWVYNDWTQLDPPDADLKVRLDLDGSLYINDLCYGRWANKRVFVIRWDNALYSTAEQHIVLDYGGRTAEENEVIDSGIRSDVIYNKITFKLNLSNRVWLNYQFVAAAQPQQWELLPSGVNLTFHTLPISELLSPVIDTYISNGYLKESSKSLYTFENQTQTLTYNPPAPNWTDVVKIPSQAAYVYTCQATWGSSSGAQWLNDIGCNMIFKNIPRLTGTPESDPVKLTKNNIDNFSINPTQTSSSSNNYIVYRSYTNFKLSHKISYQSLYTLPDIDILQDTQTLPVSSDWSHGWAQTWYRNWTIHCYLPGSKASRFLYAIYIAD